MGNKMNIKNVRRWLFSFILFGVFVVFFVICFLYDTSPILYLFFLLSFVAFLLVFLPADRKIKHPDGYTLIQAMLFVIICQKKKMFMEYDGNQWKKVMQEAKNYSYTKHLNSEQLKELCYLGKELVDEVNIWRIKDV